MKLPPLPQARVIYTVMPDDYRYGHVYGYTAADMRAYALAAIEKRSSSQAAAGLTITDMADCGPLSEPGNRSRNT